MADCCLEKDRDLERLEENGTSWHEIIGFLAERWKNHPDNIQYLLRLGAQCWGELVFTNLEMQNGESRLYNALETLLSGTLEFGLVYHREHAAFLCLYGYFISAFPYYFPLTGDYDADLSFGKDMIRKAHAYSPLNVLAAYLASDDPEQKEKAAVALRRECPALFPGNSEMDRYFQSVWG